MSAESLQANRLRFENGDTRERWRPGDPHPRDRGMQQPSIAGEERLEDDIPPIDDALVPPLTTEDDVEGG